VAFHNPKAAEERGTYNQGEFQDAEQRSPSLQPANYE
jgi:hypothetical protein